MAHPLRKTRMRVNPYFLFVVLCRTLSPPTESFVPLSPRFPPFSAQGTRPEKDERIRCSRHARISPLKLVPLNEVDTNVSFLSSPESNRLCIGTTGNLRPRLSSLSEDELPYALCLIEEEDLPEVSRLTVDAFGAAVVTLSGEINEFERALIGPTVGLWNAYTDAFAFVEVLSGLRSRIGDRLQKPNLNHPKIDHRGEKDSHHLAAKSSLVLALARRNPAGESPSIDAIASVELRLQPTDAKIPFSQPWLDGIERNLAQALGMNFGARDRALQPYLSNLCVAESARGRNIGKSLVRCVESIAKDTWGYSKVYLHVDLNNTAALNLYKSEGFRDVGFRWNPFWAGGAADIGYFVKDL